MERCYGINLHNYVVRIRVRTLIKPTKRFSIFFSLITAEYVVGVGNSRHLDNSTWPVRIP